MKSIFNQNWTEALGLTIFDSLWQGALVLAICSIVLVLMKKASAARRYYLVLFAIASLPVISVITFNQHYELTTTINSTIKPEAFIFLSEPMAFSFTVMDASESQMQETSLIYQWRLWTYQNASFALFIWVIGALFFTIRLLGGFYLVNNLKRSSLLIDNDAWSSRLFSLKNQMRIKPNVLLKESNRIDSPLVLGIIKPMIIFPMGLIEALPTDQIEAILVHELAHIKRKDFLINIVINVLQVIYFFHPAYWWLSAQLDAEREFHCDEIALNQLGQKLSLVKALATITSFKGNHQPALAFAGKRNLLLERIKRIVDHKPQINWLSGLLSLGILGLSFFLLSFTQPNQEESQVDEVNDIEELSSDTLALDSALTKGEHDFISENRERLSKAMPNDSSKVGRAVLEMLMPDSPIKVKNVGAKGLSILVITRNEVELEGDELLTYTQAYDRIKAFSKGLSANSQGDSEQKEVAIELERLRKEVAQLRESNVSQSKSKQELKVGLVRQDSVPISKGIRIRRVGADRNEEININDSLQVSGKVRIEINRELQEEGFDLGMLNADIISHISIIKGAKELTKLAIDTTAIDGLIKITTKPNVDWKSNTNQTIRVLGVSFIRDEGPNQQNKNTPRDTVIVAAELDGVKMSSISDITMADVNSIKVIKEDEELYKKGYDTTVVTGVIMVETHKGNKKQKERNENTDYELFYELDGKIVTEKQFKAAGDQMTSIVVLSNLEAIRILSPELKGDKIKLVRASTREEDKSNPDSVFETRTYQATTFSSEYQEVVFGNIKSQTKEKEITFKKLKDSKPIIELDGILRPDLSIQQLYKLLIRKAIIIQGDKIFDYYKKRELKGYDTLVKVFTK